MTARVAAFVAAVGMVVAALALRQAIDGDSEQTDTKGNVDEFVLVCASELGELCRAVDGTTEAANRTADRLIGLPRGQDARIDAWLVPGPWPQMVDEVRGLDAKPPIFAESVTLGRTLLVLVTRKGGFDAACAVDWACIGEAATAGARTVGAPPSTDVTGILIPAAALAARIGRPDYSRAQIEEHAGWVNALSEALDRRQFGAGSLRRFLTIPGSAHAFVTTRAAAHGAGVPDTFDAVQPEPAVTVALTLGLREGVAMPSELDTGLLKSHGWSTDRRPGDRGGGLPSPDVLYAVREFLP